MQFVRRRWLSLGPRRLFFCLVYLLLAVNYFIVIFIHSLPNFNDEVDKSSSPNHFIEQRKQYQASRESQMVTPAMLFNSKLKLEYQCSETSELRDLISMTEQVIIL